MPSTGSNGKTIPPSRAPNHRARPRRRTAAVSDITAPCAGLRAHHLGNRPGRFVFDVDPTLVRNAFLALPASGRPFRGQRADVEALAEQMNALEVGEPLDQPADAVVHGKPGFARWWVSMAASPAADSLLECRGEAALGAAIGPRVCRHAANSKPASPTEARQAAKSR